jgi:hypothetical protein
MRTLADYDLLLVQQIAAAIQQPRNETDAALASLYRYFLKCYKELTPVSRPPDTLFSPYAVLVGSRDDAKLQAEISAHIAYRVANGGSLAEIISRTDQKLTVSELVSQPAPQPTQPGSTAVISAPPQTTTKSTAGSKNYPLWSWGYFAKSLLICCIVVPLILRIALNVDPTGSGISIAFSLMVAALYRVWRWSRTKTSSKAKRLLYVVGAWGVINGAIGVLSLIGMLLFGAAATISQATQANARPNPTTTSIVMYIPEKPTATVNSADETYVAGAQAIYQSFTKDVDAVNFVMGSKPTGTFGNDWMFDDKWKGQIQIAMGASSADLNAVYQLQPSTRYKVAHEHLLNATVYYQQYVTVYLDYIYTAGTRNPTTALFEQSSSLFLQYQREWAEFNNEMNSARVQ